ncbi:MAG: hypothetical protein GY819_18230 [Planctomycetaceae bacterium]|nr:hypothetical protein [Planctomycetaceae bacterium]MCP4464736.1 hypothetical protein [Planctomycetaceae bacterium]MDG1807469.1 hypothetical protein [Pirellulaceae bacterium]MDG2105508.1 hypothetical protein [Pirellulaceae bacterium]
MLKRLRFLMGYLLFCLAGLVFLIWNAPVTLPVSILLIAGGAVVVASGKPDNEHALRS